MHKIQKHIALLLLLTFTIPVFYQQVHILWYHSNIHAHHYCEEHKDYKQQELFLNHMSFKLSEKPDNKTCAICEFKFIKNKLHEVYQICKTFIFCKEYAFSYPENKLVSFIPLGKPSRAPPVSLSII